MLGAQTQLAVRRTVRLDNPLAFVAMRFPADSASALTSLHLYYEVFGRDPGLCVEVVDQLVPKVDVTVKYPGTDTGATTTGWEDQGNGAANFGEIDDWATDAYLRNASALAATSSLDMKWRGSTTTFTAQQRITDLWVQGLCKLNNQTTNGAVVYLRSILNISGTDYFGSLVPQVRRTGDWQTVFIGRHEYDPSTLLGWTRTGVNNFLDASTDEFGFRLRGKVAAEGFQCAGLRLVPYYCRENRYGFYSALTVPIDGWVEVSLGSTAATAANRHFWVVVSAPASSPENYITIPVLGDTTGNVRTTSGAESGEHRDVVQGTLTSRCGVVDQFVESPGGGQIEALPILFDISNTIQVSSNPYVETDRAIIEDVPGGIYLEGTSSYLTTADSAKLSVTADLSVRGWMAADDWTPGADQTLVSKWLTTGNQRSWYIELNADGTLAFHWSATGSAEHADSPHTSTTGLASAASVVDGQGVYWRHDFDVDNGAAGKTSNFYYSLDGITWTALGSAVTTANTSALFDSTAAVEIGSHQGGTLGFFSGTVYEVEIHAGLTEVDVRSQLRLRPRDVHADALDDPTGFATRGLDPDTVIRQAKFSDTTVNDAAGNTYTLGGAALWGRVVVAQQITSPNPIEDLVGFRLPVGWATGLAPTSPLILELKSGAAAAQSGRGTTVATGYLFPPDESTLNVSGVANTPAVRSYDVEFNASITPGTSTQYYVVISSATAQGRGWLVPVQDTRSDDIDAAGTTTAAEIQGTTQGGTTDAYTDPAATRLTRYDIPVALLATVSGASSVAATAVTAA